MLGRNSIQAIEGSWDKTDESRLTVVDCVNIIHDVSLSVDVRGAKSDVEV